MTTSGVPAAKTERLRGLVANHLVLEDGCAVPKPGIEPPAESDVRFACDFYSDRSQSVADRFRAADLLCAFRDNPVVFGFMLDEVRSSRVPDHRFTDAVGENATLSHLPLLIEEAATSDAVRQIVARVIARHGASVDEAVLTSLLGLPGLYSGGSYGQEATGQTVVYGSKEEELGSMILRWVVDREIRRRQGKPEMELPAAESPMDEQIHDAIRAGEVIRALRLSREFYGMSVNEARRFVRDSL